MDFNIGPRMLKTGIAVILTLVITNTLQMELELVAAIAAVLAMQPSIMRSFTYFKEVVIGNSVAVVFSLIGIFLLGNHPLSVGAVVIISIAINVRLGLSKTVNLTVLTIIAIMLQSADGINVPFIINRVSLVVIGVVSAFIVNAFVFPPNHQKMLFNQIEDAINQTLFLLRVIPNKTMSVPTLKTEDREIEKKITKIKDYFDIIVEERSRLFIRNKIHFLRSIVIYKHMIRVLEKQYTLITQLEKNIEEIEALGSGKSHVIKKLINEMANYSENVFLLYQNKIVLDRDLQRETKNAMRLTINNLIEELQGSGYDKWTYVFPVANSLIELFAELDKLEKFVRKKENQPMRA
ncbi:FUSC family protein [Oceanobacillus alkalisoli]|uniref:FUSC family protein n=1 Tax=Oceanobacillus alkalisoli TaxID=2925113 RepID=UPI001EF07215|nr:aromatic acid exporter family protein [Oceanobacillus alkalisoli]MCF3943460.1 aromatic acid exporter family protein [Oceanobacillus alkalisoli]MCG5104049.1 aromatic acid exporter family protein [Oceanobacillus alkalisoli]